MGVITRLYHRSEGLTDNRYNVFFMDMGENIHIHYRDIRIELSSDEFLEFAELFQDYMPQVKGEIERGYRDGVRPNTNQTSTLTTFSSKRPLKHGIRYNPNRISIEENLDGYHIHLRNYKLLLDKPSFSNFVRAAKEVFDKRETPIDLDETLTLIAVNDLPHCIGERMRVGDQERAVVTVEKPYYRKTQQLLDGLHYTKVDQSAEALVYEKGNDRLYLKVGPLPKPSVLGKIDSPLVPFDEYIKKNAKRFTPSDFNLLKLQLLDFFEYVKKNKIGSFVELDYQKLVYDTAANKVIFPTKESRDSIDIAKEYERLTAFFSGQGLSFVKPDKIPYTDIENRKLEGVFHEHVKKQLAKYPCVSKVYLLNASSKKRSGQYEVPFVHFDWAKLGSDFDLLIEIDERYPIPQEWDLKFFWKACSSDYYHLGDVDYPIASPYIERFPNIDFHHHLVEAYLFFGSKGDRAVKNEYLKKFQAALLYQKNGEKPKVETDELLREFLVLRYGIEPLGIEKLDVPSFNEVFRIRAAGGEYAAKIMKREDFTPAVKGHSGEHLEYEAEILEALSDKGVPIVVPLRGKDGKCLQEFDNRYCMLLPYLVSDTGRGLSAEDIRAASRTLASVHAALSEIEVGTDRYRFNEAVAYWINQYSSLYEKFSDNDERAALFKSLLPEIEEAGKRVLRAEELPWLHSHGDICPRNFFHIGGKAILFDFQVVHYGPRIEDIAEGALEFSWRGTALDETLINDFIATYEAQNPLTAPERKLLPVMLFLQATFKLARSFRVQVLFGYKVDQARIKAFLDYACACQRMIGEDQTAPV